jgi:hypothetical protein
MTDANWHGTHKLPDYMQTVMQKLTMPPTEEWLEEYSKAFARMLQEEQAPPVPPGTEPK